MVSAGASETVATVGLWKQEPNIYNAIPRHVQLDIDIRDTEDARRDAVIKTAFDAAAEIAARRKCNFSTSTIFSYPAGISDPRARALLHSLAPMCHHSCWQPPEPCLLVDGCKPARLCRLALDLPLAAVGDRCRPVSG